MCSSWIVSVLVDLRSADKKASVTSSVSCSTPTLKKLDTSRKRVAISKIEGDRR